MRIMITGGAGFIGSHLVDALVQKNFEVAVLDNLSSGSSQYLPKNVHLFKNDICDRDAVFAVFKEFQPEVVSHQAAQSSVVESVRNLMSDCNTNIIGTLNLLDASIETNVTRFVFASTGGAIYGEIPPGSCATIDRTPKPLSPYAIGKLAAEHYVEYFHRQFQLPVNILRYANVYGSRQSSHGEAGVVGIFLQQLRRGEPLTIFARKCQGDDGCIRDYIHVSDVVGVNLRAITGGIADFVLNVGTGIGTPTRELALQLMQLTETEVELIFAEKRDGDVEHSVLEVSRFQKLLPPPLPLTCGLRKTISPEC
ncbi:UDP-glucose 4-epimerase [Thalassoglobus neptunius]|uniref:UDP-glucose 4-epimerase n=1 Tax=Thalassoglobus neptunius TaxID=1938619 RepID=A0A5C5VPP3_9PLAN|nr:NAD-dependent epimerase/dehydratase family protein [Thalassoglobus neptunius]TWT39905.1 UDP-glucose 4-epimerase [Thalassoglobus neptunius]